MQPASVSTVDSARNRSTTLNLSSLKDGTLTYSVQTSDSAGNSASDSKTGTKAAWAAKLAFVTPVPAITKAYLLMSPVVLQLTDSTGHAVAKAGVAVSVQIDWGKMYGTTTVLTDANGKATFNNLRIYSTGSYKLRFSTTLPFYGPFWTAWQPCVCKSVWTVWTW